MAQFHGLSHTPEHDTWLSMKRRCADPKKVHYSGRGIKVCKEWRNDFLAFLAYMGPKPSTQHSIDRIDNDKGYEPGNVRWATPLEQTLNRRVTHYLPSPDGEGVVTAKEAEAITSISSRTLRERVARGTTGSELFELPGKHFRGQKNPAAKISESDVLEIRRQLAAGELQRVIGKRFGLTQGMVSAIKLGRAWAHVTEKAA